MASGSGGGGGGESDFSVLVLGSDFATDAGAALLTHADREDWHDCLPDLSEGDACFSDLEELQVVRVQGVDRAGRTVVRVVGKFFPAPVIDGERLKKYVFHKLRTELPEGPFCILYIHSTVQSDDNNPGIKGVVEIPDFVVEHDKVLEHRPLTDYGIEPDPLHLADVPAMGYSLGRYEDKWAPEERWYSRNYM
ncbi:hypothetical protein HU200_013483 [Digitaria exilis]|uniref:CRAL-TRIO domain-containing protein n=1 Tax=Digitaria exilis TaxID=1010633 RepID=A0A835FDJ5_9POAL|nr:hypothetical protein HU200_013483 [Digitaria exilis]